MKKFILGFITAAVLFGGLAAVATAGLRDVRVADDVSLYVHGSRVQTDIVHAVRDDHPYGWGRNYVSARDLAEALGYFVDWCEATRRVLVTDTPPAATNHSLIGTWAWDGDASYRYVFNSNERGTRGFPGFVENFAWSIPAPGQLNIYRDHAPLGEVRNEQWNYSIAGNVLTMDSRQFDGLTFSYIRHNP